MKKKQNNQLISILFNIVLPVVILTKFSKESYLGPIYGLIAALAFPLVFGLYELIIQKQKSFISLFALIGVLLSGVIGLLQFPPHWFAVKEAAIPFIIGLVVLISTKTSWQLIRKFIYNRELLNIDQIDLKLSSGNLQSSFTTTLDRANIFLACSFFFSAVINYFLAKMIVHSMPGTEQFNDEIAKMTMLSFPIIVLPSVVIMIFIFRYIFSSIKSLTQLNSNEIFAEQLRQKS